MHGSTNGHHKRADHRRTLDQPHSRGQEDLGNAIKIREQAGGGIGLIRKGSKTIVGEATLTNSLPPLTRVLENMVKHLGGKPRPPSPLDAADKMARTAEYDKQTRDLFRTPEGIRRADEAVVRVGELLHADAAKLAPKYGWTVAHGRQDAAYTVIRLQGSSVLLNWQRYVNSVENCELRARVFRAPFETPDEQRAGKSFTRLGQPNPSFERTYTIRRGVEIGICWGRGQDIQTSEQVAGERGRLGWLVGFTRE